MSRSRSSGGYLTASHDVFENDAVATPCIFEPCHNGRNIGFVLDQSWQATRPPLPSKRTRRSNARAPQAICPSTSFRWHRAKGCKMCIYHRRTGYAVSVLCDPYMVLLFFELLIVSIHIRQSSIFRLLTEAIYIRDNSLQGVFLAKQGCASRKAFYLEA